MKTQENYHKAREAYLAHLPCTCQILWCDTCMDYQIAGCIKTKAENEKLKLERFAKLVAEEVVRQLKEN